MRGLLGKEKKYFQRFKNWVARIIHDRQKVQNLISEASDKSKHYQTQLEEVWDGLQTFFRMVKYWIKGDYKGISTQTIISILAALLYFITPLDAFPDFFVGGLIDDITIIGWVIHSARNEIESFIEWENSQNQEIKGEE